MPDRPDRKRTKATRRKLDEEATRLLEEDRQATYVVMQSILRAWEGREKREMREHGGDLPAASLAASSMFEAFARWANLIQRGDLRDHMADMPALLGEFVAASIIFAKTYGNNVYLPVIQANGKFVPPPKHDVERPALRLVKAEKRRKSASNEEKKR